MSSAFLCVLPLPSLCLEYLLPSEIPSRRSLSWDVGRRLLCLLSAVQTRLCNPSTHPSEALAPNLPPKLFLLCFLSSIITRPCRPRCSPPPPLSCTWLFILARLILPLTLISAPTLYLFSSSHISLHCFVVPVPFSIPPLFLAILKNHNGIVTASPKQNKIQFAWQKPSTKQNIKQTHTKKSHSRIA